jgi:transcriptional regulator with XRE-family HTH domain
MTLPLKLRILRVERGLTQEDVEHLSGISYVTISAIERGKRKPHDLTLAKLAEVYGISAGDLIREKG